MAIPRTTSGEWGLNLCTLMIKANCCHCVWAKPDIVYSILAMLLVFFFSPALCACLQSLHLQNCLS